jgi:hypothetical protein
VPLLPLFLSRFLSRVWFLEDLCTWGFDSTLVRRRDAGVPIQEIYFRILGWIREAGVIVKHRMCVKI